LDIHVWALTDCQRKSTLSSQSQVRIPPREVLSTLYSPALQQGLQSEKKSPHHGTYKGLQKLLELTRNYGTPKMTIQLFGKPTSVIQP